MSNTVRKTTKIWAIFASLCGTPLLLFLSTSNELYLDNQIDLGYQWQVLLPFAELFGVALLCGICLFIASQRYRCGEFMLWGFYLFGPFFLIAATVRGFLYTAWGALLWGLLWIVSSFLCGRRFAPHRAINAMALLSLSFLVVETSLFVRHFGEFYVPESYGQLKKIEGPVRPNIYHILLDEYQSDMFELILDEQLRQQLRGFVYFPENTTLFYSTKMSLPTVFLSKRYDFITPPSDYQKKAFSSQDSLLYWLKKHDYTTMAHIRKIYWFRLAMFDKVHRHRYNARRHINLDYQGAFRSLWVYSNIPPFAQKCFSGWFCESEALRQFNEGNFLLASASQSYHSFLDIIEQEEQLPANNRYTFIHLMLPHSPYKLYADCSAKREGETGPLPQSRCTMKLVGLFLQKLRQLDRFDNSLIIIHGDHGAHYRLREGKLVREESVRSPRTLLLLKNIGSSDTTFQISPKKSSLLDIMPTIFDCIGMENEISCEGFSLLRPLPKGARQKKYFYRVGPRHVDRYIIENGEPHFDTKVFIGK